MLKLWAITWLMVAILWHFSGYAGYSDWSGSWEADETSDELCAIESCERRSVGKYKFRHHEHSKGDVNYYSVNTYRLCEEHKHDGHLFQERLTGFWYWVNLFGWSVPMSLIPAGLAVQFFEKKVSPSDIEDDDVEME